MFPARPDAGPKQANFDRSTVGATATLISVSLRLSSSQFACGESEHRLREASGGLLPANREVSFMWIEKTPAGTGSRCLQPGQFGKLANARRCPKEALMNLQPLGDRLIVEVLEEEESTVSGIVLPDTAREKPQRGRVLAVGPGARDDDGEAIADGRRRGRRDHLLQVRRDRAQGRARRSPDPARVGRAREGRRQKAKGKRELAGATA